MIYTDCDLQIAVFRLLSLFWTNTKRHHQNATTQRHHLHHSRHSERHPPRAMLRPFPRWKGSENAGVWRVEKEGPAGVRGFSRPFFPPSWCGRASGEGSYVAFSVDTERVEPRTGRSDGRRKGRRTARQKDGHGEDSRATRESVLRVVGCFT